ncbi:MFS transporter [Pseudonocardia sp. KRD291]|uniref:MFS transporter n=1 Tax=Pseudonocardia sp. KRD291 TaxID=2792007 RepID=UPI001C4A1806|nr:MFS transporter [Pseudonocardia sp. KRD291]MBW0101626.1 MFS transporter [Pseudonocardia sp. KRD291]
MDLLDSTVMNVAAPSVRAELGGSETSLQWYSAAYTLVFGSLLIVAGRWGDRWGRRLLLLVGVLGFTAASVLCAAATGPELLIAARTVQGGFGALMIPQGFGILTAVFAPEARGRVFAMFGPVMSLAGIGGPLIAGGLIALDLGGLGWRTIFLINVPLGLLAAVGVLLWVPADRGDPAARFDLLGTVLVVTASALLVFPLVQGRESGWPWWTFVLLTGGVALFAVLARRQRTSPSPVLVPSLLAKRSFVAGLLVAVVFFTGVGGLVLVLSVHFQIGLGLTALSTAVRLSPIAIGILLSSLAVSRLQKAWGLRAGLYGGFAVEVIGLGALGVASSSAAPYWISAAALLLIGLGLGVLFGPLVQLVLTTANPHEVGSASGGLNAVQQLCTAAGVAAAGTLYFAVKGLGGLLAGLAFAGLACLAAAALVPLIPSVSADTNGASS